MIRIQTMSAHRLSLFVTAKRMTTLMGAYEEFQLIAPLVINDMDYFPESLKQW